MKPERGSLAICSLGCLGLITADEPQEITYPDGNKGVAYVGIHLSDKVAPVGSPWSSRNPRVIGKLAVKVDVKLTAVDVDTAE